ncbi:putative septation inhibitor protein [Bifidobacterium actinocoloniiforme DSM 22766]|uniref:Cell division protein CrgA n=1 Tax=Bifidobacterium actinocoloniiforme DSM 22766 TaxID=1437605 RepID=A0A086YWD6_9BIFI|nr:cell division protein CrgA [Bifidobacterium actinocoloniiforme]AKV55786.1 septation inhibitor protein [Bifidobacterium actinocoloniiforme DSM 22766]KFI38586.1 putative septation inhibitor protein [Bifidobacterium actinocoloniiforme DSM 22766]
MAEREAHDGETGDGELKEAEGAASEAGAMKNSKAKAGSEASGRAAGDGDAKGAGKGNAEGSDDEYGISMDKVEAVLNQDVDKKHMTPQMRRIVERQEENSRRVEETIKSTRANPRWFVPLFITLMLLGLIWIVVYYLAATMGHTSFPIPKIGQWNLLVGFGILLVGFFMTMWWR